MIFVLARLASIGVQQCKRTAFALTQYCNPKWTNYTPNSAAGNEQRLAELGWTQEKLAKRLGLKQPNVAAILSGRHKPTLATVQRVAEALNCTTTLKLPCDAAILASNKSGKSEGQKRIGFIV